jgi:hypothetical protein
LIDLKPFAVQRTQRHPNWRMLERAAKKIIPLVQEPFYLTLSFRLGSIRFGSLFKQSCQQGKTGLVFTTLAKQFSLRGRKLHTTHPISTNEHNPLLFYPYTF